MNRLILGVLSAAALASPAMAQVVSVKLTSNALGLGSSILNGGSTVSPDVAGKFVTSPTLGMGSILYIQRDGHAGLNNLLATVTARTHLDTLTFPTNINPVNDFQAGVLYMTNENTTSPDGRDEGLGVRAFTVFVGTGVFAPTRTYSGGAARIEGSVEVSGGTGPSVYDPSSPNGAPHVDEEVFFNFAANSRVSANSLLVTLSRFTTPDKAQITVHLLGGGEYTALLGTTSPGVTTRGSDVWDFRFGNFGAFSASDVVDSFSIRAVDNDPANPRGTAEHFFITGFNGTIVPAPSAAALIGMAGLTSLRRRRR